MKQALILTDSVGAPRRSPILTLYRHTWVSAVAAHLQAIGIDSFAYTERSLNSTKLLHKVEQQFRLYEADLVILQVGVTDLNARLLSDGEKRLFDQARRVPLIQTLAARYLERNANRYRERGLMEIGYETAEQNFKRIRLHLDGARFLVVPVVMTRRGAEEKFAGDYSRTQRYNDMLRDVFEGDGSTFLDDWFRRLDGRIESYYSRDNFHLNHEGHRLLAETVIAALPSLVEQRPRLSLAEK